MNRCKSCLASSLAEISSLFCLLALGRACASCKSTSMLVLGHHNRKCMRPSKSAWCSLSSGFLACCDLLPHGQYMLRCTAVHADHTCPLSITLPQARHATAGLSCVYIASHKLELCSLQFSYSYTYVLTCKEHVRALTSNHRKRIPAAIIAFQSDKSVYTIVPDPPSCREGSHNA